MSRWFVIIGQCAALEPYIHDRDGEPEGLRVLQGACTGSGAQNEGKE